MGKSVELLSGIGSKDGNALPVTNFMQYANPTPTFLEENAEPDNTHATHLWVKGMLSQAGVAPQTKTLITSNPFTFASGITAYYPKPIVTLKTGDIHTPFGTAGWDETTGDITTTVFTGVDGEDYYLWV